MQSKFQSNIINFLFQTVFNITSKFIVWIHFIIWVKLFPFLFYFICSWLRKLFILFDSFASINNTPWNSYIIILQIWILSIFKTCLIEHFIIFASFYVFFYLYSMIPRGISCQKLLIITSECSTSDIFFAIETLTSVTININVTHFIFILKLKYIIF